MVQKLSKQLESELIQAYNSFWASNISGDMESFTSSLADDFSIFGSANGEIFFSKKEAVAYFSATADQLRDKVQLRNRDISVQPVDDHSVVVREICDVYVLIGDNWTFYGRARISCIVKMIDSKWKVLHHHASFPDHRTEEGQQLAAEKIEKENLELREAVRRRTAELELKNRELEAARKNAENALTELQATQKQLINAEKMASLGELTAGIAHEIQNPLNFVNNFSEVSAELVDEMNEELEKGDLEEVKYIASELKENLSKINHHGKRADAIVKGMLEHSKRGSGQKEPTDLNALADDFLRMTYQSFLAKDPDFKVELQTKLDADLPRISVIPQDIGKVLLNLYSNAFYACTERSRSTVNERVKSGTAKPDYLPIVTVSSTYSPLAGGQGGSIEISVKDNGPGIPEAIKDKIFQPFFTTKPTGSGTGLGLSLSYDIVKAHGGELTVETMEGQFTRFIVHLPLLAS